MTTNIINNLSHFIPVNLGSFVGGAIADLTVTTQLPHEEKFLYSHFLRTWGKFVGFGVTIVGYKITQQIYTSIGHDRAERLKQIWQQAEVHLATLGKGLGALYIILSLSDESVVLF